MASWTDDDIYRIEAELAEKGVAPHARAFRIATEILGPEFSIGFGRNPQVDQIFADCDRLFPDANQTWPGHGIGLATSVDRVRKITMPVVFGTCSISVFQGLEFDTHDEFVRWCRNNPEIALRASFAFADIFDLAYGRDELGNSNQDAADTWRLAFSQLELTTNGLIGSFDLAALTQSICMTVELSLKAALMQLGVSDAEIRTLGHDNAKSAALLASLKPHRDDALIAELIDTFPPYVGSRYKRANLTRLGMAQLALASQFIAASTLRRLSSSDFASRIESEEGHDARRRLYI